MYYRPDKRVGVIVLANAAGGILIPTGPHPIPGWEYAEYDFLVSRLLDEAVALP